MNRSKKYKDFEKFRKTRNRQKKTRNDKSAKHAFNNYKKWTIEEDEIILKHEIPDSEISQVIGRTVSAIMVRRSKLKHFEEIKR